MSQKIINCWSSEIKTLLITCTMFNSWYIFAVAVVVSIIPAASCQFCDIPSEVTATLHPESDIFKDIKRAILEDDSNLSNMRRAFFHSPTASPVLIKVVYNLSFAERVTIAIATHEISHCSSSEVNSTIDFNQQSITYGWTSSGVFTAFHPIVLNMMQVHAPFAVLRIIHKTLDQRGPEADAFLWDGSHDLPTLHLNIHITSISCAPSNNLFHSVLKDFNTLLKVYTAQQENLKFSQDQDAIGFTLPSTSVSTNIDPFGSDVTVVLTYSLAFCLLYLLSMSILLFWFWRGDENNIDLHFNQAVVNNRELISGLLVTTIIAIAYECILRIRSSITWTMHSENSIGIHPVWLSQSFLLFLATTTNICVHIYICFKRWHAANGSLIDRFAQMFNSNFHIALPLQLMAFGLLYCFFPAILLIFAYPTPMLAIVAFVPTYLFVTTVVFAILFKFIFWLFHQNEERLAEENEEAPEENNMTWKFIAFLMTACIALTILYSNILTFLYSVIIGRVNTGLLFMVPSVPYVCIKIASWIADRMLVINPPQN